LSYSAVCFFGMTIFLNIDISQGSVEIYLRRGGVYKYDFIVTLPVSLTVKTV